MIKCSGFGLAIMMITSDFCQNCNLAANRRRSRLQPRAICG